MAVFILKPYLTVKKETLIRICPADTFRKSPKKRVLEKEGLPIFGL